MYKKTALLFLIATVLFATVGCQTSTTTTSTGTTDTTETPATTVSPEPSLQRNGADLGAKRLPSADLQP